MSNNLECYQKHDGEADHSDNKSRKDTPYSVGNAATRQTIPD